MIAYGIIFWVLPWLRDLPWLRYEDSRYPRAYKFELYSNYRDLRLPEEYVHQRRFEASALLQYAVIYEESIGCCQDRP